MAPRKFKTEVVSNAIVVDYPTPGASMRSGSTSTPKKEFEAVDLTMSDEDEATPSNSFPSHDGLPAGDYAIRGSRSRQPVSVPATQFRRNPQHRAAKMVPTQTQGLEFVGYKVKLYVDAISDLTKFGLEHVVELPRVVLVGDQSAGKSSLMSALTEVKLPRDQGICTKCPANVKTSPAETWSCKISLQQNYRYSPKGRTIYERSVTGKDQFPPWEAQPLEIKDFMFTEDKADLEDGIKWAQIALLNHDEDHSKFIPKQGERARPERFQYERDHAVAKFSPNLIAVDIAGPGLPPLSFYDLPGVFRKAPDQKEQYLVKVIENLANKYIMQPNALIIWTLAMKTDPSNSETGNIISKCKATKRCVGVLTNPDHVLSRHREYEKVLQHEAHEIGHGYFVTRQPGEDCEFGDDPNYHALAREKEKEFFNTSELWNGPWSQFRSRCGTTVIQKFLASQLAKQIELSIPDIQEKIRIRTLAVEEKLSQFPDLPDVNVRYTIMRLLAQFSADAQRIMDGESIDNTTEFQSDWSELMDIFRDLILHMKPTINPSHDSDRVMMPDVVEILSDGENEYSQSPFSQVRKRAAEGDLQQPPRKNKVKRDSTTPTPQTPGGPNRAITTPRSGNSLSRGNGFMQAPAIPTPRLLRGRDDKFVDTPFAKFSGLGRRFIDLDGIRKLITNHSSPGTPNYANPKTHNELAMLAVAMWEGPLQVFMNQTFKKVQDQLQAILKKHLGKYAQTLLYRAAEKHLHDFIQEHISDQRKALEHLYKMENYKLFTFNKAAMSENEGKEYSILKAARRNSLAKAWVHGQMRMDPKKKFPADMPQEEKNRKMQQRINEVKEEQLGTDAFDHELRVAAYVRAYYITAGIRFVDSVFLSVHSKLFRNIKDSILYHLESKLDIDSSRDGDDACRRLMEEDDEIAKKRNELKKEKASLTGFSNRLARLVEQVNAPASEQSHLDAEYDNGMLDPHEASTNEDEETEDVGCSALSPASTGQTFNESPGV